MNPPKVPSHFTAAEFFAGIGLVRMGLEREGGKVIFANDIDPQKYEMYAKQFPDADEHFALADIHKLNFKSIPHVEVATASFPCTDLSLAGSRTGLNGKQSSAYWGFIEALSGMEQKPKVVLLENVTGFLTSNAGHDFEQALLALNNLGYSVDSFIIDAANFVPQSRQRLFVIGNLIDPKYVRESTSKQYGFLECSLRPKHLARFILEHPLIHWNLRDLPELPIRTLALSDVLEDLEDSDPSWWSEDRTTYLVSQMSDKHRALIDAMTSDFCWSYGTVFRRVRNGKSMAELRTDGIAGCLRTPKGGSGRQILVKCGFGKFQVRLLSARECARLMGAGDYTIDVPLNKALFGFGDAVCVDVISWITKHYIIPLLGEYALSRRMQA